MRKTIDLLLHRLEGEPGMPSKAQLSPEEIELLGEDAAQSVRGGDREYQPMIYPISEQPGIFQKIRIMDLF